MRKIIRGLGLGLGLGVVGIVGLAGTGWVNADDDDGYRRYNSRGVAPVTNALYAQECGSCHMAYQPGLLPARSWRRLMDGLADHFGDNAELPAAQRETLLAYLVTNAADNASERRVGRIARSVPASQTPLRISETRYLKSEHRELSVRMVERNPQVRSRANCAACHTRAEQGSYREHEIRIPGFGRWDD